MWEEGGRWEEGGGGGGVWCGVEVCVVCGVCGSDDEERAVSGQGRA